MLVMLGAVFNALAALIVFYVAYRNWRIHEENVDLINRIEDLMRGLGIHAIGKLRSLLDDQQRTSTAGDAGKEVRH